MKKYVIILAAACITALSACGVLTQVGQAYNFAQCKFAYKSLSHLDFAGVDLSGGLSIIDVARVGALLGAGSGELPLSFDVNLDVTNPNAATAALQGVDYILSIDGVEFTTGSVRQALSVPAGGRATLPLSVGFDLRKVLSGASGNAALGVVENFLGVGHEKSNVSLQLRPSFLVAGVTVPSPAYIPVNFAFGGGK